MTVTDITRKPKTGKKPQVAIMNAAHDLPRLDIRPTTAGSMPRRIEALQAGKVGAVSLMEPWISYAQKLGLRILVESHSTRSEAAGDDLDGKTLAAMFRAQARACEVLEKDPRPYVKYLVAETGGLLQPHEFQNLGLLNAPPQPYTRESWEETSNRA